MVSKPGKTLTTARVLYWFRTDLRLTDSPAIQAALAIPNIEAFYPIWCFDPSYVYSHNVGVNRWSFLLESMEDLSNALTKVNSRQKLHVIRGNPEDVLVKLWKEWGITHLAYERDPNGYSRVRDKIVGDLAEEAGIEIVTTGGRHLFDPEMVVKVNGGKPTMTLHQWQTITKKIGIVGMPAPSVESLPDPGETKLDLSDFKQYVHDGHDANEHIRTGKDTCFETLIGPNGDFAVPTLESLGFEPATTTIHGGPTEGQNRLALFLSDPIKVATFSKPNTAPTALEPSTTLLSPYIKFGCIGIRELWWGCQEVVDKVEKEGSKVKMTKEPENMFGQLQFRDMYAAAEYGTANFQKIHGNPVCRFVDWGLRNQHDSEGKEIIPRPRGDETDEERFAAWKEGRTGFPWIDACMRQLKKEGWIHHLARHSVACFLTRGQCYISWERGMEVFDEWLIDWDPASNPGNWMWLACSAFFSQYFRVYGLVSWPAKTDKSGALVRMYCPELNGFPDKYIYAPHLAPLAIQEKAKCIIGKDYPHPMLDEQAEKQKCIARLKNAFSLGLHGDSPEVLEGTAGDMLRELHEKTGALGVKSEKEVKEEKGEAKRKKEGNGSLDAFVKKAKK